MAVRRPQGEFMPAHRQAPLVFPRQGLTLFANQRLGVECGLLSRNLPVHLTAIGQGLRAVQRHMAAAVGLARVKGGWRRAETGEVASFVSARLVGLAHQRPLATPFSRPVATQTQPCGGPTVVAFFTAGGAGRVPVKAFEGQAHMAVAHGQAMAQRHGAAFIGASRRYQFGAQGFAGRA